MEREVNKDREVKVDKRTEKVKMDNVRHLVKYADRQQMLMQKFNR